MSSYHSVLTACKTTVLALPVLSVAGATGAVRKRPFFSAEHGDALPFVTFSPEREMVAAQQQSEEVWLDYPVYVVLFLAKNATLQNAAQLQLQLDAREAIRKALWRTPTPPLGIPGLFHAVYDPEPAFDLGGLDELFDVSLQRFTFRVPEQRGL